MAEVFKTSRERIIGITKEIMDEVDHNKPKIGTPNNFIEALKIGSKKFENSSLREIMNSSRR